uniref:FERM domain-containing protein n=1 Tax=Acrobeloides nanus TaxID=290746 RepID=A0A914CQR9_9BILA
MDFALAVLRLRRSTHHQSRDFCSPQDFEILLHSSLGSSKLRTLLQFRTKRNEDPTEAVLRFARRIQGVLSRRAVPIPVYTSTVDVPCSSSFPSPPLICLPLTDLDFDAEKFDKNAEFCNFAHVLNDALNESPSLDLPTRHFVRRIEEWLAIEQRGSLGFLSSLFHLKASAERTRLCVHNPAYDPQLAYFCRSILGQNGSAELRYNSSYLEEAVKQSNKTRAKMIQLDKYDQYQMNPLYGAKHSYKRKIEAPEYYAKGRKIIRIQKATEIKSPKELWELHYPLHKAAFDGDAQRTKMLLAQGWDPNVKDDDTWTPLHYAAFYNKLDVCSELLLHSKIDVNITNKTGITALHFAALNAHEYVVELILTHSRAQTDIKDNTGRTAYDLCANMPKKEWQDVANLLRKRMEPSKIEVHLSSGLTLQVKVNDVKEATAGEVRDQIFAELELDKSAEAIFAIWIMNSRLSLQLNAEQKIMKNIEKWKDYIEKWGDEPSSPHATDDEVRIVFQRDAKTFVRDEEFAVCCHTVIYLLLECKTSNRTKSTFP